MLAFTSIKVRYRIQSIIIGGVAALVVITWLLLTTISDTVKRNNNFSNIVEDMTSQYSENIGKSFDDLTTNFHEYITELEKLTAFQQKVINSQLEMNQIEMQLLHTQIGIDKMINEGAHFDAVAKDIASLRKSLPEFYNTTSFQKLDKSLIIKIKRLSSAYFFIFKDIQRLDKDNVSMTQLIERSQEAHDVGFTFHKTMDIIFSEIDEQVQEHIMSTRKDLEDKLGNITTLKGKILADIARNKYKMQYGVSEIQNTIKNVASCRPAVYSD